jgi:hypothetical protein
MTAYNYIITLQLTDLSSDQTKHIGHAKTWANWHNVKGSDGVSALNEGKDRNPRGKGTYNNLIYWHVYGELADVFDMCKRWAGGADSYGGQSYGAFTPTVQVMSVAQEFVS